MPNRVSKEQIMRIFAKQGEKDPLITGPYHLALRILLGQTPERCQQIIDKLTPLFIKSLKQHISTSLQSEDPLNHQDENFWSKVEDILKASLLSTSKNSATNLQIIKGQIYFYVIESEDARIVTKDNNQVLQSTAKEYYTPSLNYYVDVGKKEISDFLNQIGLYDGHNFQIWDELRNWAQQNQALRSTKGYQFYMITAMLFSLYIPLLKPITPHLITIYRIFQNELFENYNVLRKLKIITNAFFVSLMNMSQAALYSLLIAAFLTFLYIVGAFSGFLDTLVKEFPSTMDYDAFKQTEENDLRTLADTAKSLTSDSSTATPATAAAAVGLHPAPPASPTPIAGKQSPSPSPTATPKHVSHYYTGY